MDILNELTGGYFEKKINSVKNNELADTYNVYVKFDDDKPLMLLKDINIGETITFKFDNELNRFFQVACPYTGKTLKFYTKNSNLPPNFNQSDYIKDDFNDDNYTDEDDEDE